ncbi:MAG: 3-oxoacyl-[acyl-carrier-protein] synthase III C-terminal domain-containing protein [Nitrospinaceae bacterium]|jgi:3-oxoacyl-[acyl-carrier-protein] synthase III|nr:3-oxoacyl-[acyl-carrier-protein] synthase III C-terminal domain-containing protein [Nitrospinaceae bacterium]|tara:strand:+ start:153 stop:1199 length:1047 start_codon:yes stop_codon:yes gene_type:complete
MSENQQKIGIEAIVSFMPDAVVTQEDFSYLKPVMPEDFPCPEEMRRIKDVDAVEQLAVAVADRALKKAGLTAADCDLIIANQCGGKYVGPMVGTYVHNTLGFSANTPVFNVQNCCSSLVEGLYLAWNLIRSGAHKRALVFAVSAWDADAGWGVDRTSPVAATMGDGAGAMIVSTENLKGEFLAYSTRTYGDLYEYMVAEFAPSENPELEPVGRPARTASFRVDPRMFEWFEKNGEDLIRDTMGDALEKAGLGFPDIDFVFPHQCFRAALDVWSEALEKLGVSRDKWVESFDRFGNIGAVDVAPNLEEMDDKEGMPAGSIIAMFVPGGGGHTPTLLCRWLEKQDSVVVA